MLHRVSPFGDLRIEAYLRLPEAYRSLSRPSSAPDAKAFPLRSYQLDLVGAKSAPYASAFGESSVRSLAPPLQFEPASLGFKLVSRARAQTLRVLCAVVRTNLLVLSIRIMQASEFEVFHHITARCCFTLFAEQLPLPRQSSTILAFALLLALPSGIIIHIVQFSRCGSRPLLRSDLGIQLPLGAEIRS